MKAQNRSDPAWPDGRDSGRPGPATGVVPALKLALLALVLAPGCHRPLVIKRDDMLLHASPEPPPQPRTLRPTPAPAPPPVDPPYHPE